MSLRPSLLLSLFSWMWGSLNPLHWKMANHHLAWDEILISSHSHKLIRIPPAMFSLKCLLGEHKLLEQWTSLSGENYFPTNLVEYCWCDDSFFSFGGSRWDTAERWSRKCLLVLQFWSFLTILYALSKIFTSFKPQLLYPPSGTVPGLISKRFN